MAREVIKFGAERARGGKKRENTKGFLGSLPPLPPLFLYSLSLSLPLSLSLSLFLSFPVAVRVVGAR